MARLLKDIEVNAISLVGAGANNKALILKSKNQTTPNFDHTMKIVKSNDVEGLIYITVYSPDEIDAHNDFTIESEIKKSAHNFMKKSKTFSIDVGHDGHIKDDTYIAESYILKIADPEHFPDTVVGSWVAVLKTDNEEIKEKIQKGEITGASLEGKAVVEEVEDIEKAKQDIFEMIGERVENAWINLNIDGKLKNILKSLTKKEEKNLNKEDIQKAIDEKITPIVKELDDAKKENETLKKENEEMKKNLLKSQQLDATPPEKPKVDVVKMALGKGGN